MLIIKRIQLLFSSLLLFITLVSVSGSAPISSNYEKVKTEIVSSHLTLENATNAQYKSHTKTNRTAIFNSFIAFNFKSILNMHSFDFSLSLKSQKNKTKHFLNYLLLEQNLIAQIKNTKHKATS